MWHQFLTIFLSLLLPSLLVLLVKRSVSKPDGDEVSLPPSPPKLPFLGNINLLAASFSPTSLRALSDKYGPLMLLQLGRIPTLIVSSPEVAREVLKTHDAIFASRPASKILRMLLYGGTFSNIAPYGEGWRQARKLCVTHMLGPKMTKSFRCTREEEVALMIAKIRQASSLNPSGLVDMTEVIKTFAAHVVCRASSCRFFTEESRIHTMLKAIEGMNALVERDFHWADFLPGIGWLDIFDVDARAKRCAKELDDVLEEVLCYHASEILEDDKGRKHADFVDVLLSLEKDGGSDLPSARENIKTLLIDVFSGSTDTTSTALLWGIAELARNREALEKLQDEVRRVAGCGGMVREEDLGSISFLRCVFKEVLRLHPPGPLLLPRESMGSCELEGYRIPKRTRVIVNAWGIARDPKYWEEPDQFKPERFVNNPADFIGNDFRYIPFGSGRRICPGMNFAVPTFELALANLVHAFDWELPGGTKGEDLDMRLDAPGGTLELVAKMIA